MTKRQFRVLYREFLFRMVDLEVLSAHALGDAHKLLGQFAALLLFVSNLLSMAAFGFAGSHMAPPARLAFTVVMEHFLIATTMLVVGLFAVLSWDSTFPDRRDVLVLAPLPVRPRTIFLEGGGGRHGAEPHGSTAARRIGPDLADCLCGTSDAADGAGAYRLP